jgi:hypothetical protein
MFQLRRKIILWWWRWLKCWKVYIDKEGDGVSSKEFSEEEEEAKEGNGECENKNWEKDTLGDEEEKNVLMK